MDRISTYTKLLSLVLAVSLITLACDNPIGGGDDHADAVGFVLEQNNAEILRFENNQYEYNRDEAWDEYFRDGEFTLSPDVISDMERGMTPSMVIRWLDPQGNVFDLPDDVGGEYTLGFSWDKPADEEDCDLEDRQAQDAPDNSIRPANIEQHGSDGLWGFHFRADHVGEAEITWSLNHGNHSDFTSRPLNVVVADDEHELIVNGQYLHERSRCRTR